MTIHRSYQTYVLDCISDASLPRQVCPMNRGNVECRTKTRMDSQRLIRSRTDESQRRKLASWVVTDLSKLNHWAIGAAHEVTASRG